MHNRSLFFRAALAASAGFILVCVRALIGGHEFASKWSVVFAAMLFGVCVVSPFIVAFAGRNRQVEWPWSWVFAVTYVTTAILGFGLYAVMRLLQ
jgi:uncharacterized membrane protein YhaH (DUF805 family)